MTTAKIAGAPISWGVCEVPGWGHQLAADRVLAEMHDAGLAATELGPEGFLPADPGEFTTMLSRYGLSCVGTFVPVLLHDADHDPVPDVVAPLDALISSGGRILVLAAATGSDGYDSRPDLDDRQWATLLTNLDRIGAVADERGLTAVLHPHVGTMVETRTDVDRVLTGSAIALCLDTGHLLIGGTDPHALARRCPTASPTSISRTLTPVWPLVCKPASLLTPKLSPSACTPHWAPVTSTSSGLCRRCAITALTAGSCWSRTPSLTPNPPMAARCAMC